MEKKSAWNLTGALAVLILIVILALAGVLFGGIGSQSSSGNVSGGDLGSVAGVETELTSVPLKTVDYEGQDGKTALEILQSSHKVEIQESSIGKFIVGIDGDKNTDDTFWMFYVNGTLGPVGADQYKTKNGEKIEWRLEKFQ